jgi:hypothetical protein
MTITSWAYGHGLRKCSDGVFCLSIALFWCKTFQFASENFQYTQVE